LSQNNGFLTTFASLTGTISIEECCYNSITGDKISDSFINKYFNSNHFNLTKTNYGNNVLIFI